MLDLCLTVLMGSPGVCVWEIGRGLPGMCFFSRQHICCTDVDGDGDGSGGYFSAAAGGPHHIITL